MCSPRAGRGENGKICDITCVTRDGLVLAGCTLGVFRRLRTRRFIRSTDGGPYRISRQGLDRVRSQLDNL